MMQVFIENESGSDLKNHYDEETLTWLGSSSVSARYPFPYGFVIGTEGGDGDAVDCFVLTQEPLEAGTTVSCQAVGLMEQNEDGEIDHKILATLPGSKPELNADLHATLRNFAKSVFRHIPGKTIDIGRLLGADEAAAFVESHRG